MYAELSFRLHFLKYLLAPQYSVKSTNFPKYGYFLSCSKLFNWFRRSNLGHNLWGPPKYKYKLLTFDVYSTIGNKSGEEFNIFLSSQNNVCLFNFGGLWFKLTFDTRCILIDFTNQKTCRESSTQVISCITFICMFRVSRKKYCE